MNKDGAVDQMTSCDVSRDIEQDWGLLWYI